MRPRKLTLENIGPFAGRAAIDFTALDEIFLITGKTGSGKTTIFDAICFALYGTVPGSRRGHVPRLRSDYAGENQECFVSLDFSLGEKRYRIDRSPKQEKFKKRGIGTTTVDETAALYEILPNPDYPEQEILRSLSGKKSEADRRIEKLIGLSADEFFKIVLLPQGEFAEFLRQNTTQRREVLSKLFPVDIAVRLREFAQERAREASAATKEAERALGEISRRLSFDKYKELHAQAEEDLKKAKNRSAALDKENRRLEQVLKLEESLENGGARLADAEQEWSVLEEVVAEIQEKEARLNLSRKGRPLERFLVSDAEKREAAAAAGVELEKAALDRASAEQRFQGIDAREGENLDREKELVRLRERRPRVLEILDEEKILPDNQNELKRIKTALENSAGQTGAVKKAIEDKDREIAVQKKLADELEEIDSSFERRREIKDKLVRLKQFSIETEEVTTEEKILRAQVAALEVEAAVLEKRVPVLQDEIAALESEKESGERNDMAAHLATGLKSGEPCPVCGSTTHPLPATAAVRKFGIRERLDSQRTSLKDAESFLASRKAELEAKSRELSRAERKKDSLREQALPYKIFPAEPLPPPQEAGRLLEKETHNLSILASRQKEARRAADRIAFLYREREGLLSRRIELEKNDSVLQEKYRSLEAAFRETGNKHKAALRDIRTGEGTEVISAAEALESLDTAIRRLDAEIQDYREARETAGRELAAARAREEGSRANREDAERQYTEAAAALNKALAESSFKSPEDLQKVILDRDQETLLDAGIFDWKEKRSRNTLLREELERSLGELRKDRAVLGPAPAGEELRTVLENLALDRASAEAARDETVLRLASLERDEAQLREALDRREILAKKAFRLNAMADDLSGKNPKKKAFDSWLLGLYLTEVAAFATKRLERMSESRYSLILDSEGDPGRGRAGLDLAVFDAYTGKTRPCATLSGGESFMASISLALGLADSIQVRSGGVRLDAVFIDEGFGSLDESSLDKALIILDELREHRMVGLISHVGEMRSRIPSRIEVIKTGAGSRVVIEGR
jgi:exonuclease SbcC